LKLQIISLPADLCLQLASRGNNVLQPAVNMVIETIQEIENFVEKNENKQTDSDDETSLKEISQLTTKLDTTIQLLNLSINAYSLVGKQNISVSVIMQASYLLRKATTESNILEEDIQHAKLYKIFSASTASGPQWKLLWTKASVSIVKGANPFVYFLCIDEQKSKDIHYDDDQEMETLKFSIESILSLVWSTTEQMKIRTGTYSPALLFDVPDHKKALISYGIEFCDPIEDEQEEEKEKEKEPEKSSEEEEEDTDDTRETDQEKEKAKSNKLKKNTTLVLFEHILKLCVLEHTEENDHFLINDEKLYLSLSGNMSISPKSNSTSSTRADMTPRNLAQRFAEMQMK